MAKISTTLKGAKKGKRIQIKLLRQWLDPNNFGPEQFWTRTISWLPYGFELGYLNTGQWGPGFK